MRNLQRLMLKSRSGFLFAIRRVCYTNRGRFTPGYDETTYSTPESRWELYKEICSLDLQKYSPIAVKRVYIPKPDGRQRPVGLPTQKDRVIQCIFKNALEPEWEANFENSSYGFLPKEP